MTPAVQLRLACTAEVLDLRHAILRAGLPRETASFEGDAESGTRHVIATIDGLVIGCVTILRRPWNDRPAWQLRGMAVASEMQKAGIGSKLLVEIDRIVRKEKFSDQLWCNARVPAAEFYQRHGWQIASEQFDIPTAGPHVKMTKRLA